MKQLELPIETEVTSVPKKIDVPKDWFQYEHMVRKEVFEWIKAGKPDSLTKMAYRAAHAIYWIDGWEIVCDLHRDGSGRIVLLPPFRDWVIQITNEIEDVWDLAYKLRNPIPKQEVS